MKTGLVMEGGAMKGIFTCGVIDVLMEHGVKFDGAIGVSAGACFGCNYKSNQPGRAIRYNKKYVNDKRYASVKSLITTGDFYGVDFCYRELPLELDVWDAEVFYNNPMEFYVVATDCKTGKPVYHLCKGDASEDLQWIRASASVPIVSRVVEIGDERLLDGGIADSVPLEYFQSIGYEKNLVITTKPVGYRKKPEKKWILFLEKLMLHKYPEFIKAHKSRYQRYNELMDFIDEQEKSSNTMVIRPPEELNIGGTGKSEENLERVYQLGRKEAERRIDEIIKFVG